MHVRVLGKVCRDTGAIKSLLHGRPGRAGKAAHRDGAVRAVKRIMEIGIVLQFLEIGQHPLVGPLRVAPGGPGGKILRGARSLNAGSIYLSHRSAGSTICMSESMTLKPFFAIRCASVRAACPLTLSVALGRTG